MEKKESTKFFKVPSREFLVENSSTLVVWTFQFYPNSSKLLWESRTVGTVKGAGPGGDRPLQILLDTLTILQSE